MICGEQREKALGCGGLVESTPSKEAKRPSANNMIQIYIVSNRVLLQPLPRSYLQNQGASTVR